MVLRDMCSDVGDSVGWTLVLAKDEEPIMYKSFELLESVKK